MYYSVVLQVPEVMDAVLLQSDLTNLTKNVTIWERKIQIAEVALYTRISL